MNTFCSYFNRGICSSCDLISSDYRDQLLWKEDCLLESLSSIKMPGLLPTVTSPLTAFRNKAKLVVTGTMENPIIGLWGLTELDSGRELIDCPLHYSEINGLVKDLKSFISLARLEPYQISTRKGELKGLIVFYSDRSHELYLRFILRSQEAITRIKKHLSVLIREHPNLQCISANIQPIPHAVLEGSEEIILSEASFISHDMNLVRFDLGPQGFVQTNQKVSEQLYLTAARWMQQMGRLRVVELFCGQGAFSFFAAPYIEEGLGIEINADAVVQANLSAKKNNLEHLHFKCADAKNVAQEVKSFMPDLILVNPPRKGLSQTVDLILSNRPRYIIYSSCSWQTLAEDLIKLDESYLVDRTQIFDMFPHTRHFETLLLLRKRD